MRISRDFELVDAQGERTPVTLWLGEPSETDNAWQCPCGLTGLRDLPAAHGVDAMQSVQLAFRILKVNLEVEISDGQSLYWLGEKMSLSEFFSDSVSSELSQMK